LTVNPVGAGFPVRARPAAPAAIYICFISVQVGIGTGDRAAQKIKTEIAVTVSAFITVAPRLSAHAVEFASVFCIVVAVAVGTGTGGDDTIASHALAHGVGKNADGVLVYIEIAVVIDIVADVYRVRMNARG